MTNPTSTLIIKEITENADIKTVLTVFEPYGKVVSLRIPVAREDDERKNFGFVQFSSEEEANRALEKLDSNVEIGGEM